MTDARNGQVPNGGMPPLPQPGYPAGRPPQYQSAPQYQPTPRPFSNLADGQWHRLNRLGLWSTLAKILLGLIYAGIFLTITLVVQIGNAQTGAAGFIAWLVPVAFLLIMVITSVFAVLRFRSVQFRVNDELFEIKEGVIARRHRQIRLDRLQSINLNRPVTARIFGLTEFVVSAAGNESDIKLSAIGRDEAEVLRADVLRRASGLRQRKQQQARQQYEGETERRGIDPHRSPTAGATMGKSIPASSPGLRASVPPRRRSLGDHINGVLEDFSQLDNTAGAPEHATLRVSAGRMAGATLMSTVLGFLWVLVMFILFWFATSLFFDERQQFNLNVVMPWLLVGLIPFAVVFPVLLTLATALQYVNYSITGTPDGIRIARGWANQTSDTVPPGRIHSVQVSQPLLWRMFGWYSVQVNRIDQRVTSTDSSQNAAALMRTTPLPVGKREDVIKFLSLALPMHMGPHVAKLFDEGMSPGKQPGYVAAADSAFWLHPFSFRRLGYAINRGLVVIRNGRLRRRVVLVPSERIQSVSAKDSPLERLCGIARVHVDTVSGPVNAKIPGLATPQAEALHLELTQLAVETAKRDNSHRWGEASGMLMLYAARFEVEQAQREGRAPSPQAVQVLRAQQAWEQQAQSGQPGQWGQPEQPQPPHPDNRPPQPRR